MSQKVSPTTPLTPLPISLQNLVWPSHPLAKAYVVVAAAFSVFVLYELAMRILQFLLGNKPTWWDLLGFVAPVVVAKLAILSPAHELLHAWQMRRAGIPWSAIHRKLFAIGNAWVSAPNYAISFREAQTILLTPLALAAVYVPLSLLVHGPFHFGVLLVAFEALVGPCHDVAVLTRFCDISRIDPDTHIVERFDARTRKATLYQISLTT